MFENGFTAAHVVYATAALSGIMLAEAVYLLFSGRSERRNALNRRIRLQDSKLTNEQVLIQLRKERGVSKGGLSLDGLRKLRIQSGLTMPMARFLGLIFTILATVCLLAVFKGVPALYAVPASVVLNIIIPIVVLRFLRKRRHKKFGLQLPEALELITRGLKAGHPVPVALSKVAGEMTDPIGTEFGIVADEITYGSDLVSALNNMFERVGHEDLPLFVTAVSIQSGSGGNLREILDGLSATIRERGKLRRKVRAVSSEGRMSAYILDALPALLMAAIMVLMPDYYNDVWGEPLTWYMLFGSIAWLLVGNAMMFKMANFRI